ncbi:MAG TPA: hypothetical protein P5077_02140 [bacterium]|nr:hypothetical protein [bacterium]
MVKTFLLLVLVTSLPLFGAESPGPELIEIEDRAYLMGAIAQMEAIVTHAAEEQAVFWTVAKKCRAILVACNRDGAVCASGDNAIVRRDAEVLLRRILRTLLPLNEKLVTEMRAVRDEVHRRAERNLHHPEFRRHIFQNLFLQRQVSPGKGFLLVLEKIEQRIVQQELFVETLVTEDTSRVFNRYDSLLENSRSLVESLRAMIMNNN